MGIIDKLLFLSFVPTTAKKVDACNIQELANIAWAYAVADAESGKPHEKVAQELSS